uniref:Protein phosphatase 1 regulatory inhibitor subunit 16B n=1 Tax=Aceria tosichella TaxID=561515 RepID=A0A6G1SGH4_9ACAR
MADHDELVAEMLVLEQMGTQERQKLAKKRRMQQLKKWSHREKEWIAKEKQLNKRLANILNEENNGLNLKQYTTYNSNQRTKKRLTSSANNYNVISSLNGISKSANDERNNTNDGNIDKKSVGSSINNNNLASIDGPYSNNLTPTGRVHFNVGVMLLEAAARNDHDEVKRLLSLGVSPDSVNHDGLTALHQCCIDASELIMNLLLEYGANVDARDTERWTPLHAACTCGHLNLVKILVEHGADLLAVNGDGNMPFDICEDEATLDYIESQMIKRGITQEMIDLTRASSEIQMLNSLEELASSNSDHSNLNYADDNGVTQLHIAATNNYLSVIKFLLKHGVNVNVCDNDQWTPLHGVACWGNEQHIKVAEMLVEAGADLDAKTSNDETVFDLCDNAELLERLNQLKDELEKKQAIGTDRLRRTQSRTNSRVHSVRRTRVQDKNQISRREAREEAMLRVESSENINGGGGNEQPSSSLVELRPGPGDTPILGRASSVPIVQQQQQQQTRQETVPTPLETNLDQQTTTADAQSGQSKRLRSSSISVDRVDSVGEGAIRSQSPKVTAQQAHQSATEVEDAQHVTSMTMVNEACDLPNTKVHLAPINYTLSNLKKHRSDLRLRGVSIIAPIQLDPEPALSSPDRPQSLNKFHGQPSLTIEDHRREHKCCVII